MDRIKLWKVSDYFKKSINYEEKKIMRKEIIRSEKHDDG